MTAADLATTIVNQIADATPEVIEAIRKADISDDAKLAMLYFADPEFRAAFQGRVAEALAA